MKKRLNSLLILGILTAFVAPGAAKGSYFESVIFDKPQGESLEPELIPLVKKANKSINKNLFFISTEKNIDESTIFDGAKAALIGGLSYKLLTSKRMNKRSWLVASGIGLGSFIIIKAINYIHRWRQKSLETVPTDVENLYAKVMGIAEEENLFMSKPYDGSNRGNEDDEYDYFIITKDNKHTAQHEIKTLKTACKMLSDIELTDVTRPTADSINEIKTRLNNNINEAEKQIKKLDKKQKKKSKSYWFSWPWNWWN